MGHVRLGILPRTRAWNAVVQLITDGADVDAIASATSAASDKAFVAIQKDPGFTETVVLMTELGIAAKKKNPVQHLKTIGLKISEGCSVPEIASAIQSFLDEKTSDRRQHTDFAELSQNALVSAITSHLGDKLGGLFTPSSDDVRNAMSHLGRPGEFGKLARTFFERVSHDCMRYFLSKAVGAEVGEGKRFATIKQVKDFEVAMAQHSREASVIVEECRADRMSCRTSARSGRRSPVADFAARRVRLAAVFFFIFTSPPFHTPPARVPARASGQRASARCPRGAFRIRAGGGPRRRGRCRGCAGS